jgi:hypothetical protein
MDIDTALKSFMKPYIKNSGAFAKGKTSKQMKEAVLLTFASMGWARAVTEDFDPVWVPTDQLKAHRKTPNAPIDLTSFMRASGGETGERQMTESLRLMISDMVAVTRKKAPARAEDITIDSTLLIFAELGTVTCVEIPGNMRIWVAAPEFVEHFEFYMSEMVNGFCTTTRRRSIQMDDVLERLADQYYEKGKMQFGKIIDKRQSTLSMLLAHELSGDVIAYKDSKGRWPAPGLVDTRLS